jgi:putrescine transport system permease protein
VTLPILIYSRIRLGLRPDINALATIIILVVAIGVLIAAWIMFRQQKQRELELKMSEEA